MAEDLEFQGRMIEDRELSILFQQDGGYGVREFLPKSQIAVVHDVGGRIRVTVPLWLAKQKGLF